MADPNGNAIGAVEGVRSNKYYIVSPVSYFHTELPATEPNTNNLMNVARMANVYSGESTGLNPWLPLDDYSLLKAYRKYGSCANTYAYNQIIDPTKVFYV